MNAILLIVVLAAVLEGVMEYVLGIWWTPGQGEQRKKLLQGIGLALGIAVGISGRVDIFAYFGFPIGIVGNVLTGVIIGRGGDFAHQILELFRAEANG